MGCKVLRSSRAQQPRQIITAKTRRTPKIGRIIVVVAAAAAGLLMMMMVAGCQAEDVMDDGKIGDIRDSIVEALGLQRIPDPAKANVSQAEYERAHKEYLTRLRRSAGGAPAARQRRLFTMYATEELRTREGVTLSFPMRIENYESALVESATLRLLLDHDLDDSLDAGLEVLVYRKRPAASRRRLLVRRSVQEARTLQRRWLEFDLTDEIAAAASLSGDEPVRFLVQLLRKDYRNNGYPVADFSVSSAALNVHAAYLTEDDYGDDVDLHQRPRRSLNAREQLLSLHRGRRSECRGEAKKCCRHRMTVTFKDLEGFDFIIQPKSFDAGYCKGRCPPRYNPAHHHALLQSLIWKEDRRKAPRPCCAPSKLTELEILYFDENDATKLKVSNWKDMRVLECACS